jgi:hypothetical protein
MKIEPIYLVAPDPDPAQGSPPPVSRRGVLAGLVSGLALGTIAGSALTAAWLERDSRSTGARRSDDDETLTWALTLQDGPLAVLVAEHETFLWVFERSRDPRLETGIERLAVAVLERDEIVADQIRQLATSVGMTIRGLGGAHPLARLVPHLDAATRR